VNTITHEPLHSLKINVRTFILSSSKTLLSIKVRG